MSRLFTSFDEAWQFFLNRQGDLDDFFASFPEQDRFLMGWLLRFDNALLPSARDVQRVFSHLGWVTPLPEHFLHIWIGGVSFGPRGPRAEEIDVAVGRAQRAWANTSAFDVHYRRVNCFHSAIVVEVEGDGPRTLAADLVETGFWRELPIEGATSGVQMDTFLAHLTIGVVSSPSDPTALRDALIPVRDVELGRQRVTEATLCIIPATRTTALNPWNVVGSVVFREHS